jgi:hypothetical protein
MTLDPNEAERSPRCPTSEVDVVVLHAEPEIEAGPLSRATAAARLDLAERHRRDFLAAGATRARVISGPPDGRSFGARLRDLVARMGEGGLVILGSGAIPLATAADRRQLVAAATGPRPGALTNNRFSGDVVAIACARSVLAAVPDLATDNMLPRWLDETAGIPVRDHRDRRRLGIDIDGPLDLVLVGGPWRQHLDEADRATLDSAMRAVRAVADDPGAEVLISGRVSASNLGWLERRTASRTRALVEERGFRTRRPGQRPAASVLGALLEHDGPESFGDHLARLADAAIVDSRVLLAHRLGADGSGWPPPEDRFASDMLLPDRIADPWLRSLTASAVEAAVPVLLGGHTLVGPGLPRALRRTR